MTNIDRIALGDEASDSVTGFTGIVTAKALYSTGCNQVLLSPPVKDDGGFVDGHWFDIERIAITEPGKKPIHATPGGGPRVADAAPVR